MNTKAGDVVIWEKDSVSLCQVAVVHDDGEQPSSFGNRWQTKSRANAEEFARSLISQTGGRILVWDGSGEPTLFGSHSPGAL